MDDRSRSRTIQAWPAVCRLRSLSLTLLALILLALADPAAMAVTDTQIGPGVAGQLHAVAFDPTDPDMETIYVGGDNFGVYRSTNLGGNWEPWNQGMEHANPKRTSYVDDILVVPPDPSNPTLQAGVYAATFGGIIYRPDEFSEWEHQTMDLTYDTHLMEDHGGAIPFASLGFDPETNMLYAGTGRARLDNANGYEEGYYPDHEVDGHRSLWCRDLDALAGDPFADWTPVMDIAGYFQGNVGQVWQIDIVSGGSQGARLAIAAQSGIYIQGVGRAGWIELWDCEQGQLLDWPGYSEDAWGIAVGGEGRLYAITKWNENDDHPAVWTTVPTESAGEWVYSNRWEPLDAVNPVNVPPWDNRLWTWIIQYADMYSVNVIPATNVADEQVFVGMISSRAIDGTNQSEYGGYFRFGKYRNASGVETSGWVNFITQDTHTGNQSAYDDFYFVDYSTNASNEIPFDPGWVRQFPLRSTVPLAIHPNDPNRMFAAGYHIPLFADDVTDPSNLWTQRYCDEGSAEYFDSRGLEEMSPRAIGFTEPAAGGPRKLVIGCGDFQAFLCSDEIGSSFKDMDPFYTGKSMGLVVETIGEEIYVLRGAAGQWGHSFGYCKGDSSSAGEGDLSRQEHVIARYNPINMPLNNGDGLHWEFVSRDFDTFSDVPAYPAKYDVIDFVVADESTMFAALRWYHLDGNTKIWHSLLARGSRSGTGADWSWVSWWKPPFYPVGEGTDNRARMNRLEIIPGTSILLVSDVVHPHAVTALDMALPVNQAGTPWLDRGAVLTHVGNDPTHRLYGATRNITAMACDDSGQWLYIANKGQDTNASDAHYCANVTRLQIPAAGSAPDPADWEMILNRQDDTGTSEGISFPAADPDYYPDGWDPSSVGVAESLPKINAIAIHPQNPQRIFIGVRAVTNAVDESFHPSNGLYEFDPTTGGISWQQVAENGLGNPCHGVHVLSFVPSDPGMMIAGVYGQGFFQVDGIAPCPVPAVSPQALATLSPSQTLLQLEVTSTSGVAVAAVEVEGAVLGLAGTLTLSDAGDGVWSVDVAGAAMTPGVFEMPVMARDIDWNTSHGTVSIYVTTDSTPVVSETLLEPLHVEQSLLMLKVASATSAPIDSVAVILGDGWPQDVIVLDDDGPGAEGLGFDSAAGDTVWTGQLTGDLPALGNYSVTAYASDADGNVFYGTVVAEVIDEPAMYFKNVSGKTDLSEPGMPTGVAALDLVPLSGGDYGRDVYIGRFDDDSTPDTEGGLLAEQSGFNGAVPTYEDRSVLRFGASALVPGSSHGPTTSADLDSDGLMDLVIPSGNASEGLLFYKQTITGTFLKMDSWKPVVTTANTHSWAAACADYDGDGMLDIYLCRASVNLSGILPRPGQANPLPDVLLRNDLLNSGKFVDVSTEIYEGSGGSPLSSRTAVWADFDDDGDPDLAVADAATGEGFRVYCNDPANANGRLSRCFDLDNAVNVSDVAWIDYDGNGDLELLATTFHGSGTQGEAKIYDHNAFATGDPFTLDLALPAPPPHWSSGVRVADLNLDGHLDFVMLPDRPTGFSDAECIVVPALNTGDGDFGTPTSGLGLSTFSGAANGGFITDLSGDGAPELFLGRKQDDFRFFGTTQGAELGSNWRRVKLVATREYGLAPAVGAKVTFETGNAAQDSVGFTITAEGRDDHAITIGCAPGAAPVCNIYWPNGAIEEDVALIPTDTTLVQPNDFTLNAASASGTAELKPDGLLDLVFTWTTNWLTDPASDKVTITGGTYTPSVTTLMAGVAGVTVRQWPETRNGIRVVWHEVRLTNQLCENGYLLFDAESADHGTPQAVLDQRLDLTLCTSKPPNIGNPPGDGGL